MSCWRRLQIADEAVGWVRMDSFCVQVDVSTLYIQRNVDIYIYTYLAKNKLIPSLPSWPQYCKISDWNTQFLAYFSLPSNCSVNASASNWSEYVSETISGCFPMNLKAGSKPDSFANSFASGETEISSSSSSSSSTLALSAAAEPPWDAAFHKTEVRFFVDKYEKRTPQSLPHSQNQHSRFRSLCFSAFLVQKGLNLVQLAYWSSKIKSSIKKWS